MAIEPLDQLAFAIQQYKGLYALLIGSGVSRSAGIKTGWGIVEDLICRIAAARGEDPPENPDEWYLSTFGKPADYSNVIKQAAPTRELRTLLLRQYFEPTKDELEDGLKQPTVGHHAIARLVAGGYVRIIVTTNFDRLLERAIESAGVAPAIISSRDQVKGMMPLQHTACLILKVHGDYLDTRIRNVTDELEKYDADINRLLDRIFSEYGLIICGWSAKWDKALRDSLSRNTHHRFSTFWMSKTKPAEETATLVAHMRATHVPIESADQSFGAVVERVEAIENATIQRTDSTEMAVALCKRYLRKPAPRIELHDLIIAELEKVLPKIGPKSFPLNDRADPDSYIEREAKYRALVNPLASLATALALWGGESEAAIAVRVINSLGKDAFIHNGQYAWLHLAFLPSSLVFYAAGIAAISQSRFPFLSALFDGIDVNRGPGRSSCKDEMASAYVLHDRCGEWLLRVDQKKDQLRVPASDWYAKVLPEIVAPIAGRDIDYGVAFDDFEALYMLVVRVEGGPLWPARFLLRGYERDGSVAIAKLRARLQNYVRQKELTDTGVLKVQPTRALELLQEFTEYSERLAHS